MSGAVVVSGFVALTLSPMISAKLLRHQDNPSRFDRRMEGVLLSLTVAYGRSLAWALQRRWWV